MSRKWVKQYPTASVMEHPDRGIFLATQTTVPTDATTGYAPGCIFIDMDSSATYINVGTKTSSNFDKVLVDGATVTALTVTTLTATTLVNITQTRSSAAATDTYKANTAAAWTVTDGTTGALVYDTRNTLKDINTITLTGVPVTVASEAAAHVNATLRIAAKTITYTGTTGTTSSLGAALSIAAMTWTDASMMTITTASAVHITAIAAAGGMLTITNSRMISTSVSDCYLTNAGVWTDTACWAYAKEKITDASTGAVEKLVSALSPKTWKYAKGHQGETSHGNDRDRQRVGIVYDELPDELRAPGEEKAVSPGILASFALAALKVAYEKIAGLEARLAKLEA